MVQIFWWKASVNLIDRDGLRDSLWLQTMQHIARTIPVSEDRTAEAFS
jgi:hypothetical protein